MWCRNCEPISVLGDGLLESWSERRGGPVERVLLGAATILVLNVAVVVGALLVISLPLALSAGLESLARWRSQAEEHTIASFVGAYRRGVLRKLLVGWFCIGLVGWGWLVVVEGLSFKGVWRIAIAAVGCGELAISIPVLWMALMLAWDSASTNGVWSVIWAAVVLSLRMPVRCIVVAAITFIAVVTLTSDPVLALVGLLALVLWLIEALLRKGLLERGVVLSLPDVP